ncbi:MAG: thioredoxin domain-containing protein [bacterium]
MRVSKTNLFLWLAALTLQLGTTACVRKQTSQPCTQAQQSPSGVKPPKARPDCKEACNYFTYCQSARWTSATEQKGLADRCAEQCQTAAPKSQMETFFAGIKGCAVNQPCVPFGDCMRKLVEKLQKTESGEPVEDPKAIYKVPVTGSPMRGPADALVTIVMFADYECPFCGRGNGTINQILKLYPGKTRLVYKHYPLPSHTGGKRAAEIAICVTKQKGQPAFWKLHDRLYQNPGDFTEASLLAHAKAVGADPAAVKGCIQDPAQLASMAADLKLGMALGVDGTPAFFINGRKLSGALPVDEFKTVVKEQLTKAEAAVKAGIQPADIYQHVTKDGHTKVKYLKGKGPKDPHGQAPAEPPELDSTVVFRVPVSRNHPALGPRDALVTIVEFADFQCPACGTAGPELKKVLKAFPNDVRLVYRNNALPNHPDAALAAEAALAVRAQKGDKGFFEYHDKLYANLRNLSRPVLEKLAVELGVDLARFKKALDEHTYKAQVDADGKFADQMGVPGTPAFYINGRIVMGMLPADELQKRIQGELAAAKKLVAGGVARAALYDHLMKTAKDKPVFKTPAPHPPH